MAVIKKEDSGREGFPGLFVVLEGMDGSGKTTLWNGLKTSKRLGTENVRFLREPTDLPTGRRIRACLSGEMSPPDTEEGWLKLFLDDRQSNVETNILPALRNGEIVIQDRYIYSTAAYQARDPETAREILHRQSMFPIPDLILFLDIQPKDALERIAARSEGHEFFETQDRLNRIAQNYSAIMQNRGNATALDARWTVERLLAAAEEAIRSLARRNLEADKTLNS